MILENTKQPNNENFIVVYGQFSTLPFTFGIKTQPKHMNKTQWQVGKKAKCPTVKTPSQIRADVVDSHHLFTGLLTNSLLSHKDHDLLVQIFSTFHYYGEIGNTVLTPGC